MEINEYMDENGLIHNLPFQLAGKSENGPLFTATYVLFKLLENNAYNPLILFTPGVVQDPVSSAYHADPSTNGMHFSHDNMTGMYIWKYCSFFTVASLPTFKWNNKLWLHPRDVIFYSMMKGSIIASLLGLLLFPFMIAYSMRKPNEDTSGKCLWLLRLLTLMIHRNTIQASVGHLLYRFANLLRRESWLTIFTRYYTYNFKWSNFEHPTLQALHNITLLDNEIEYRYEER